MPLAPVDDKGTHFYYEDSGPVDDQDRSELGTLVLIPGGYFNSGIFRPMLPYAKEINLRIVLLNLRDFRGSTPYAQSELDEMHSDDIEIGRSFLKNRVNEIAWFLKWYIEKENVTKICEQQGRRVGGISIATWSAGGCLSISLLGFADSIPDPTREFLGDYLRSVVLYDPPCFVFGSAPFPIEHAPLADPALSDSQKIELFPAWVTAYYTHGVSSMLLSQNPYEVSDRAAFLQEVASAGDKEPEPTILVFPAKFLKHVLYTQAFEKGLFDEDIAKTTFPKVKVTVVTCTRSTGMCVCTPWEVKTRMSTYEKKGISPTRNLSLRIWDGMNHAPHWDMPDKVVELFAEII
ncbi:hypothetical protein NLI96_g353 [Meripilus lineatus]|uniref:AB hydrolase-1 domain-containing protein n=1 Tax=Meripilus lineatus TaxID=2056292 RepID=A0AAD5VEZ4_9APHY|nr:hypothetical protein NLI96_g353 [Physisporinus lineatus]